MNKTKISSLIMLVFLLVTLVPIVPIVSSQSLTVNTPSLADELEITWTGATPVNVRVYAVEIDKEMLLKDVSTFPVTIKLEYNPTPSVNATLATFWLNRPVTFVVEVRNQTTNSVLEGKVVPMVNYVPLLSGNASYLLISDLQEGKAGLKLNLTDRDLNDLGDTRIDSFGFVAIKDQPLRFAYGQGVFEVLVNDALATANATLYLLFEEVDPGEFILEFPMSLVKHSFKVGDKVTFKWTDYYSGKVASFTAEVVTVVPISLKLDRDTYPLSNDGEFMVHITVTDPYVTTTSVTVNLKLEAWFGVIDVASVTLDKVKAWTFYSSYTVKLAQYDPNVYKFTGAKVVVTYQASDGKERTASGVIKPSTAVLSVAPTSLKVNDTFVVTLIEPDANKDSTVNETVVLSLVGGTATSVTLKESGPNTGVFVGSFRVGFDAPFDNVNPNALPKVYTLTYNDAYTAATSPSYPRSATLTAKVTVTPTTAKAWIGTLTQEVTQIGPFTQITIYFEDPDYALVGSTLTLSTPIIVRTGLGDEEQITTLNKVTGTSYTFRATLPVQYSTSPTSGNGALEVTSPDTVMVRIVDPCGEAGTPVVIMKTVAVRTWDGVLSLSPLKPFYNDKDDMVIRVTDPDANRNPSQRETVTVTFRTSSDPIGVPLTLIETGENTGVFELPYTVDTSTYPPFLKVGDTMIFEYRDALAADGKVKVTSRVEVPLGFVTATPIRPGSPTAVKYLDILGNEVAPKVGQPVLIQIPVSNADTTRSVTTDIIIVFYDANNVPVGITYGRITLGAGQSTTALVGWLPSAAGTFSAKVFFWDLANKIPLSEQPLQLTVTVS